ncbi:MAG: TolC family protein, partial [Elusimicrobiota bacterium]
REDIHGQVVFEATRAFYDVLLERKRIALARESARRAEDLPGSPSVQLLRGRLRRDLAERRRAAEKSHLAFLDALGVELYSSLDVSGELSTQPVDLDLAVLLARAQQSRPEIRQTGYQQEIDRLAVNLSLAERYPIVALGAGYELNDRKFPLETTQWNASVNFSLPLFDGFANRAQIRQRRLQANESRIRRTEVEDSINFEVRESYGDLMHWQEELTLRRAEMERAETAARAAGRSGDAPVLEAWLLETRDAYWTAVHGHVVALAKLEKAVGRPLKE